MTEKYTPEKVAELVAVAETWVPSECAASPVGAWHIIERLADALTAVSAERDEARERTSQGSYLRAIRAMNEARSERDRLHKAITEIREWWYSAKAPHVKYSEYLRVTAILRAALDREGDDDE